jgi:hypothetical protein
VWVNAYRENGRQQSKSVGAPLLANRENERPHEVKTATDIYAYRETAARFHMVNAWPDWQWVKSRFIDNYACLPSGTEPSDLGRDGHSSWQ